MSHGLQHGRPGRAVSQCLWELPVKIGHNTGIHSGVPWQSPGGDLWIVRLAFFGFPDQCPCSPHRTLQDRVRELGACEEMEDAGPNLKELQVGGVGFGRQPTHCHFVTLQTGIQVGLRCMQQSGT